MSDRYIRQTELFGKKGQKKIERTKFALLGLGGLGSHFAQQFAYLGARTFILVDGDKVENKNLNRLVGATAEDIGRLKVEVAARLIHNIQPKADVATVDNYLQDIDLRATLADVDVIMGGLDNDYARLLATQTAAELRKVYIDVATDVQTDENLPAAYGGRVVIAGTSPGCLYCLDELSQQDIRVHRMNNAELETQAKIYGVDAKDLKKSGPSVVSLNGVVASLAITEAVKLITGLAAPAKHLVYRADLNSLRSSKKDTAPCPYCHKWLT